MRTALHILALALAASAAIAARQTSPLHGKVTDALKRLESKEAAARETAYDDLSRICAESTNSYGNTLSMFFVQHPDEADRIKLGLIRLLRRENNASETGQQGTDTESYGEYVFDLTQTVSALHDERAIPVLVESIPRSGVDLLQFGDEALEPVLAQLTNPDALVRAKTLETALGILKKKNDAASRDRIRALILSSLDDHSLVVRGAAVNSIDCLEWRQEFVSTLEKIAKGDPDKLPGKALDDGDGNEFYPVRYAARRVLRDIRDNTTCQH
jgi:hypothetical protein